MKFAGHLHFLPSRAARRVAELLLALVAAGSGLGQTTNEAVCPIDLAAALRLAGARNLDIQIARERLREAEAAQERATESFFPWIAPGLGFHRRDGVAQASPSGVISDAHYQSYSPGVVLSAEVTLGDAIYARLAARQAARASAEAIETRRQEAVLAAAVGYFDLAQAASLVRVAREAVALSEAYEAECHAAVLAGVVFRGDELRVRTQTGRRRVEWDRAREAERLAGVELARQLRLDPQTSLVPEAGELVPLVLFATNAVSAELVRDALRLRPELRESQIARDAARTAKNGAVYGALIPSLGARVYGGGLGGGPDGGVDRLGPEGDYSLGISWRLGPGGLFDPGRVAGAKARLAAADFAQAKVHDLVVAQVVAALVRVRAAAAQIEILSGTTASAAETLRLTRERKQYGAGVVLEDIQAQEEWVRARADYVSAVSAHNKAQYELGRAVGGAGPELGRPAGPPPR